jgi:hypothetical protein
MVWLPSRTPSDGFFAKRFARFATHCFERFFGFFRLDFLQTHVVIAKFAEMHGKIECRQGFECEVVRPPAMAGVD